ncbi:MAG: addiction module toxin, HicA family [Deltaproteobacteria bacterium CG_4_8_14_3_um_filter_43_13]|jgi:predicted RNA binding protein YcfA (HicA-like mRNA interferase family)|nr:MAG: addiction module toxin, HicA family [Deltaproteobacteria bacterium CG2_30_43_15]PIX22982.1 MAG: addiction module toxin, HicA family [Deltaproteobacteria bacterium CG_4_8_14_3_um_filter_43_13]PIZ19710.1 MAG: addiction module toxin, HicA family [Deltaproteobacteria bacterium CG_4_10_14_0_8_um_filter_43_12]HCX89214.1 addiction module toxin, HicA family [Deltaproteobacteria bacterium]
MKRKELIKKISSAGCTLVRHGARHDLYRNQKTGKKQPVPRHDEIDENLAKHIIKELA